MISDHRNDRPPTPDAEGKVWIQLHESALGGVDLGNGESIAPGEKKSVHESVAQRLVLRDRARYVAPEAA